MSEMEGDSLGQAVLRKIAAKKSLSRQEDFIACELVTGKLSLICLTC